MAPLCIIQPMFKMLTCFASGSARGFQLALVSQNKVK